MRPGPARVWFVGLLLASSSVGCATQSSTAQALAIVGTAAVIVGASMADGDDCYQDPQGSSGPEVYCSPGLSKGARKAGTALAVAGVGTVAAGYALQPNGPDRRTRAATAPRAPTQPYRLIRQAPPEPEPAPPPASTPSEPAASEPAASEAAASEPAAPSQPAPSSPEPPSTIAPPSAPEQ